MVGLTPTIVRHAGAGAAGGDVRAWRGTKRRRLPIGSSPLKNIATSRSLTITFSNPFVPSASRKGRPRRSDTPATSKKRGLIVTVDTVGGGCGDGRPSISIVRAPEPNGGTAVVIAIASTPGSDASRGSR